MLVLDPGFGTRYSLVKSLDEIFGSRNTSDDFKKRFKPLLVPDP